MKPRVRAAAIGAILFVTSLACSRPNGEGWARRQLGERDAEKLRAEAFRTVDPNRMSTPPDPRARAYVPRPFVVFDVAADEARPDRPRLLYAPMNEELVGDVTASAVRGLVVVDRDFAYNAPRGARKRGTAGGHTEYALVLVDRATGTTTEAHAKSPDELKRLLATLPSSP